jgi:small multidrug resistance pump
MLSASLFTEEHHGVEIPIPNCLLASRFTSEPAVVPDSGMGQQMSASFAPVLLISIVIALVTVLGDWLIKVASQQERTLANPWFLGGLLVYAACAFVWVYAMQYMKLATLGVVSSLGTIVLLTVLGSLAFGETLNRHEIAGLIFAGMSVILLVGYQS